MKEESPLNELYQLIKDRFERIEYTPAAGDGKATCTIILTKKEKSR